MRKVLCNLFLLICIFSLCGCESSEKDREEIFSSLKKAKIISDSMEQIDTQTFYAWDLDWYPSEIKYIYKDKNSNLIAISYEYYGYTKPDYDHLVTIYYDATINDDVNYITDDYTGLSGYVYQNGDFSESKKYEFDSYKIYEVTLKKNWFSKKYVFKEHN